MSSDSLGDRMKGYEACGNIHLPRRMPTIVRVDGRAFHTFTRGMQKPFDPKFGQAMIDAAASTAVQMQGFVLAYVQSDEASFLLQDYKELTTEPWFGKDLSKIVSIAAATMTSCFTHSYGYSPHFPIFDARAFVVPKEEVTNYFLWRAKDWERNSLTMYAQAHFSHKQLHGKGRADMHEMLHGIGKNWATDLKSCERNGTFILNTESGFNWRDDILPNYEAINETVLTASLTKEYQT